MKKNLLCFIGSIIGMSIFWLYNTKITSTMNLPYSLIYTFFNGNSSVDIFRPMFLCVLLSLLSVIIGFGLSIYGFLKDKDKSALIFVFSLINILSIYEIIIIKESGNLTITGYMLITVFIIYMLLSFLDALLSAIKKRKEEKESVQ